MSGIVVDKISIPYIFSEEQFLLNFSDMKDFKLTYTKTKKKNGYYIGYMPDFEKSIDALYLFTLIKLLYKKTVFYIIEKNEDKFYIFGGHTFTFDKTSFFYKEITVDEIDELKEIDIINKRLFNTNKSVSFFINVDEDTQKYVTDLLESKQGDAKKLFFFVFEGNNFIVRYRAFFLSAIVVFLTVFTEYSHYSEIQKNISEKEQNVISSYKQKTYNINQQIAKIRKNIRHYKINPNARIYIPEKGKI